MRKLQVAMIFILFIGLCSGIASSEVGKTGIISGQLMIKDGRPMAGGHVFIFNDSSGPPPSQDRYWRVPDYVIPIEDSGRFSVELPEGRYYLGAIKRVSREKIGPPDEGDFFYAGMDEKGMPKAYIIKAGEKKDIGVVSEAVPFKRSTVKFGDGITAVEGTVLDTEGMPVEGALVFAYTTPEMIGRPVFVSERTGKDGKYILRVYDGGNYYLKVRDVYGGGPPVKGAVIGSYGQEKAVPVIIRKGEITKGIDIKVIRFPGPGPKKE